MLEFVERHVGGLAREGAVAPAPDDAGYLIVIGDVDRVVPGVELRIDRRRHVHPPDLQGRRGTALRRLRRDRPGMDQRVDIAYEIGGDRLGPATLRPRRLVRG